MSTALGRAKPGGKGGSFKFIKLRDKPQSGGSVLREELIPLDTVMEMI